jgi:hypothetical protein
VTGARLGLVAASLAVFALVEPRLSFLGFWCGLVCFVVLIGLGRRGLTDELLAPMVGLFAGVVSVVGYNLGADTLSYLATMASLLQDFDLNQGNQFEAWGMAIPRLGPLGVPINAQPIGPALIWAFPAMLAHGYALLVREYSTNFASRPYFGAVIATNLMIALSGALALARLLARELGASASALAVAAAVLASPVVFYLVAQPMMAHGLTFGLACWAIVAVSRAAATDTPREWRIAGIVLGLATACRFQAAVLIVLVPLLGGFDMKVLGRRMFLLAPPAVLMVLPQMWAWYRTFGVPVVVPQGSGFMNWLSPHWVDTLLSADRGLFNWHPVLLLGLIGLVLTRRPLARLALSGLTVFALTAWVNGAVRDWNGSDAFGARRYDLVIPFFAVGLARLLAAATPFLARKPLLLPAGFLAGAALWNASFAADYGKAFTATAPIDEVVSAQARRLRQGLDATLGRLGPRMRFRIYDAFVGLFTYTNYRPGGDFDLATLEPRFLRTGWSEVLPFDDGVLFRYVLFPKACIVIPLEAPFDLRGFVLARSPARIKEQRITLSINDQVINEALLPPSWTEIPFVAPARFWIAGENEFCMRLSKKRPGDEGNDLTYAAAVVRVQLP